MDIMREFEGLELGHQARTSRALDMMQALGRKPASSFPEVFTGEAELEGAYRLLRHPQVTMHSLIAPHVQATAERCKKYAAEQSVLVLHDTTTVTMPTEREGLGRVQREEKAHAFFLHSSLAVSVDRQAGRRVLGSLCVQNYVRTKPSVRRRKAGHHSERRKAPSSRESARWWRGIKHSEQALEQVWSNASVIHVADREADQYTLFSRMHEQGLRFIIRCKHARRGLKPVGAPAAPFELELVLPKSAGKSSGFGRAPRLSRTARLAIHAQRYLLERPETDAKRKQAPQPHLGMNLIEVRELNPASDIEPVHWRLWTSESIDSQHIITHWIECYKARWMVEEFFKALKTGVRLEARQLRSKETLYTALGFFVPLAWWLVAVRDLAQERAEQPAGAWLDPFALRLLQVLMQPHGIEVRTVADIYRSIARLGGHIRNNGPPGWQVLSRGMLQFLNQLQTARSLQNAHFFDQS